MTQDPAAKPSPSSLEQALTRFDSVIERLRAKQVDGDVRVPVIETTDAPADISEAEELLDPVETAPEVEVNQVPIVDEPEASDAPVVLQVAGLVKRYGDNVAVDGVDFEVRAGQIFGIVGPNGAGKTTTLSMVTGVLRPDQGVVTIAGHDVWGDPAAAKREVGILPDRLQLFDRLTGRQLLYYSGMLRGLSRDTVLARSDDLLEAFGLVDSQDRLVTDYSAGMTRKVALAAAMIHSPRLLILDEPFESVDAVSVATVREILRTYADNGGTVVLSSHSMDLVESFCDSVAIVAEGRILTSGPTDSVRAGGSLESRFVELIGELKPGEDMEWLRSFSA